MWSAQQRVLHAHCGEENQPSLHMPLSALGLELELELELELSAFGRLEKLAHVE